MMSICGWCTKQLLVVSFPLGLQQIHVAFQQRHEAPATSRPSRHPGLVEKHQISATQSQSWGCHPCPVNLEASFSDDVADVKKNKKNILDTTWHHSKISPDTHFLHPRLAILSWVWVELTIPYVFQYFPVGSYLKSKKYRKITERSRWLSSPPSKSASCAAAAAWDKDSERWKPHRITERSMAFWVIKMRCLE